MSGRRMKALRRRCFGDDAATNAASKVYRGDEVVGERATTIRRRYEVWQKVAEGALKLIGHRHVTLRRGRVELSSEGHVAYRDAKNALRRRRIGGRQEVQ